MKSKLNIVSLKNLDKTGIVCSGACATHCLLLPILAFSSPTISSFLQHEWLHLGLIILLIPIALISFTLSMKVHNTQGPFFFGGAGIILLVLAVALEAIHIEIVNLEKVLTALGSFLLITGHAMNMKNLKKATN